MKETCFRFQWTGKKRILEECASRLPKAVGKMDCAVVANMASATKVYGVPFAARTVSLGTMK